MKSELVAWIGLGITVVVYIVTITIFLTKQSDNLKALKDTFSKAEEHVTNSVKEYKLSTEKFVENIKEEFKEHKEKTLETVEKIKDTIERQIERNQQHTAEHIKRLEEKQDKHNNLIERVAIAEQSVKSAHHRQDDFKVRIEELERLHHDK